MSCFFAKNVNKTVFKRLKSKWYDVWHVVLYANFAQKYKTMSFHHLELCRLRFQYFKIFKKYIKGGHSCLLFNHLLRKRFNNNVGSNFTKEYMFIEKNLFSQKPFGQKSFNSGSIIRYIDNFATYASCYLLRVG